MNHVEQSLQYAIYELQLAFLILAVTLTESLPKPLRFIYEYFNERHFDISRNLAEYINEFIDDIKKPPSL